MTIFDAENAFSWYQAITGDAPSDHVIDLSVPRGIAAGEPVRLEIQATEDFDNLTSLTVEVEQDDNEGFASPTVLASATLTLAQLVVGARLPIHFMPRNDEQFLRLNYNVTGVNPTTGVVCAGLVLDVEDTKAYPGVIG